MSNTRPPERDSLPKTGHVNEVCQEWMVREDSALAYRLQNDEFNEHLSGNKFRNAVVREDFPRAKDEQLREQRMAEQAAAIYQKMLAEQEEYDNQVARDLAEKMEREEQIKRRMMEIRDQDVARQLLENERRRVEKHHKLPPPPPPQLSPLRGAIPGASPRRQAPPMPLPGVEKVGVLNGQNNDEFDGIEVYNEPYRLKFAIINM